MQNWKELVDINQGGIIIEKTQEKIIHKRVNEVAIVQRALIRAKKTAYNTIVGL